MILLRKVRDSMGVLSKEELELEYRAGRIDSIVDCTIKVMKSLNIDVDKALDVLDVEPTIRNKIRK